MSAYRELISGGGLLVVWMIIEYALAVPNRGLHNLGPAGGRLLVLCGRGKIFYCRPREAQGRPRGGELARLTGDSTVTGRSPWSRSIAVTFPAAAQPRRSDHILQLPQVRVLGRSCNSVLQGCIGQQRRGYEWRRLSLVVVLKLPPHDSELSPHLHFEHCFQPDLQALTGSSSVPVYVSNRSVSSFDSQPYPMT